MNEQLIAEASGLLASISSPRPWRHHIDEEYGETVHYVLWGEGDVPVGIFTGNYGGAHEDAEFIASAPTLISRLLAALIEADKADEDRLTYQLQAEGPDEFPEGYYRHIARDLLAGGNDPRDL